MSLAAWLLAAYAATGAFALIASAFASLLVRRRTPALLDLPYRSRERWPTLSVVVPACNEAMTLEGALSSLIAEDYPSLEIILVDDRSTDGTSELVDRLAASDPRIVPEHVTTLPEGWLGKVHALQKGLERSGGRWVLFTDADVHFAPGALRRAVSQAEAEGLDHLALLPQMPFRSFWLGVTIAAAFRSILIMARLWEANDPHSKRGMGVGAFNLVRREALEASPGLEWLKMEVADDVGLGIMMKRHTMRSKLQLGRGLVFVDWYPTLREAVLGLEKNGFAQAARFGALRGFGLAFGAAALVLAPFAGLLPSVPPALKALAVLAFTLHVASALFNSRTFAVPKRYLVFSLPFGDLIMVFIILRATWLGLRRGGVIWRGTLYPSRALAAGRRVDM